MPLKALPPRNRRLHFQCEKIYSLELRFSIENQTELSQQGPVLDSGRDLGKLEALRNGSIDLAEKNHTGGLEGDLQDGTVH